MVLWKANQKLLEGQAMAPTEDKDFSVSEHDWHSDRYVEEWISRDIQRDEVRRPLLRRMLVQANPPSDSPIRVIDIGGGYGVVTEEILSVFPSARVTLLDNSAPMLARARQRLGKHLDQIEFLSVDLSDQDWSDRAEGPFDLAVSAIAIHNLRDLTLIKQCYRGIYQILKPGALFLNYDLFEYVGGIETHLTALRESGLTDVEVVWEQAPVAITTARR
jgi:ubiquinone/menaquinone biosynthesis C-methylase UbiE